MIKIEANDQVNVIPGLTTIIGAEYEINRAKNGMFSITGNFETSLQQVTITSERFNQLIEGKLDVK